VSCWAHSNLRSNPSSLTAEDSLHSCSCSTTDFWFTTGPQTTENIRCPAVDVCKPHRKHLFLYCCIYSALHSNGSYSIVACLSVIAWMCLPSRCPATGLHVTIYNNVYVYERQSESKRGPYYDALCWPLRGRWTSFLYLQSNKQRWFHPSDSIIIGSIVRFIFMFDVDLRSVIFL
jgi:hypothetical protein